MQPLTKHREVISGGVTESADFSISIKDQAHIKSILRDTLYSDKILAVLREYSANAWDAHRMAGKPDLPIKIKLPTWSDPTLIIQDFGTGLSHEDVFNVFAKYGASTKRDSNEAVGMLGIGSKSGFAYSDTFTIVSRHGGKRRTYVALLDESENDTISLLSEEDCGDDVGITIQIAVRNEDVDEFRRKAINLFQHFEPRPDINCDLPIHLKLDTKLQHGAIFDRVISQYEESDWYAVMGCIPYKVNLKQLTGPHGESLISEGFFRTSGLLYFNIGEIQINASREELKYSKFTKDALTTKFNNLIEEFVAATLQMIETGCGTGWEKRIKAQTLLRLGLGKEEAGDMAVERIELDGKFPASFKIESARTGLSHINVKDNVRLIRRTEIGNRLLSGFHLDYGDYLITPNFILDANGTPTTKRYTWDVVNADLEKFMKEQQLDGLPVVDLHTLEWQPKHPTRSRSTTVNAKHRVSTFKMVGTQGYIRNLSKNWEIENRQPTPDDVFVILNAFENVDGPNIYECRLEDERIAKYFNLQLPVIYGYKTTTKKPVVADQVTGIHYLAWRKKLLTELLPKEDVREFCEAYRWNRHYSSMCSFNQSDLETITANLGSEHPISVYLANAHKHRKNLPDQDDRTIFDLFVKLKVIDMPKLEADKMREVIDKKYPLLGCNDGINTLFYNIEFSVEWQRYFRLIDNEMKDVSSVPEEKVEE